MPRKRSLIQQALDQPEIILYDSPSEPLPYRDLTPIVITFTPPTKPISVNQLQGKHWTAASVAKNKWVNEGVKAGLEHTDDFDAFRGHRIEITVAIPFPDKRRRDPHNYTGSVVKALTDGFTRSGALVPDDNQTWVSIQDPVLYKGEEVRVRFRVARPVEDPATW